MSQEKAGLIQKTYELGFEIQKLVQQFEKKTQSVVMQLEIDRPTGKESHLITIKPKVSSGKLNENDAPESFDHNR